MNQACKLADEPATLAIGAALAAGVKQASATAPTRVVITLQGPLGAGKTTLARGFVQALGHAGTVKSPTYTLVEPYDTAPPVLHMDLYRLEAPEAFVELGVEESSGVWLVEWPARAGEFLPTVDASVVLDYADDERSVVINGLTRRGERIIQCLSGYLESVA